jgi:alkanesulfonate monooxygenase SsuD/methylene tetrahydromethanopterin reductase-like flavin-dependent oxidoreductase (luciferase family)
MIRTMSESPLRLAVALNGYGLDYYEEDGFDRDILGWEDLLGLARLAERLGYERIFVPEIDLRDVFSTLAGFAGATERIGLASGVVPMWPRGPLSIGMGASSVDEMSRGRLFLGIGSGDSIDRTRQLVSALRDILRGWEGIVTDPDETWATGQLSWHKAPRKVPILLGALGPRMVALAGEVADGVILNWCTPQRVAEARSAIPNRKEFTLAVYVRACLSHVDEHATDALKIAAARYLGMLHYRRQFEAMGFEGEAARAQEALENDGHPRDVVADRLIEETCVWGEPEKARARLSEYAEAGATLVVVYPVAAGEAVSSLSGTLMAAAPGS